MSGEIIKSVVTKGILGIIAFLLLYFGVFVSMESNIIGGAMLILGAIIYIGLKSRGR